MVAVSSRVSVSGRVSGHVSLRSARGRRAPTVESGLTTAARAALPLNRLRPRPLPAHWSAPAVRLVCGRHRAGVVRPRGYLGEAEGGAVYAETFANKTAVGVERVDKHSTKLANNIDSCTCASPPCQWQRRAQPCQQQDEQRARGCRSQPFLSPPTTSA